MFHYSRMQRFPFLKQKKNHLISKQASKSSKRTSSSHDIKVFLRNYSLCIHQQRPGKEALGPIVTVTSVRVFLEFCKGLYTNTTTRPKILVWAQHKKNLVIQSVNTSSREFLSSSYFFYFLIVWLRGLRPSPISFFIF